MARPLTSGMNAAVAQEKATVIRLIQLTHSGGTLRWATSAQDIDWGGFTWTAVGGVMNVGGSVESSDMRGAGLPVALSGVDGAITSVILTNDFRGYEVVVYRAHLGSDGQIVADPYEEFRGYQNGSYEVSDDAKTQERGGGTVTIKSKWVHRLARLQRALAVRTNLHSHRDFLRRAGLTGTDLDDDFFKFVPGLVHRAKLLRWGAAPPPSYGGAGGGETTLGRESGYTIVPHAQ